MRPVVRGPCPQNEHGENIHFTQYQNARREMISRLGEYCSYCEMHLDASLAIEHVRPKKPVDAAHNLVERELDWNNFLLACTNCNSTKSNTDVVLDEYVWPDRDNTFRAIAYSEGGIVSAIPGIQENRANKLIELVGLDKTPDSPMDSDRRWKSRRETWDIACREREKLARNNNDDFKETLIELVKAKGYWSIWMTVFSDNSDMLRRIIAAMPGTDSGSFDSNNNFIPIQRDGGIC